MVVDTATGTVLRRLDFDAFGRITSSSGTLAIVPFGFAGGLHRPEIQLIRFGARDYDPELGRWTSKDPIRFDGGDTNIYAYVANDPVNHADPTGLDPADQASSESDDLSCNPGPPPGPKCNSEHFCTTEAGLCENSCDLPNAAKGCWACCQKMKQDCLECKKIAGFDTCD